MAKKCNACGRFVNATDSVACNKCTFLFHRDCVNIPKDVQIACTWLCPGCKAKTPRKDNTENPVRGGTPDYTAPQSSCVPVVDRSNEILLEVRLLREELVSFREDFKSLRGQLGVLQGVVEGYGSRLDSLEQRLDSLEQKDQVTPASPDVSGYLATIEQLKSDLNDREQDSLLNDVEITGVPEEKGENSSQLVSVLLQKLGVPYDERDIVSIERVGMRRITASDGTSGPVQRPRPLVIRLARRSLRDDIIKAARVRRHITTENMGLTAAPTRLYVNERLSKLNRLLFYKAREEARTRGWKYVWTRGGRIFARRESGKASFRVWSEMDLEKIFGGTQGSSSFGRTSSST